MLLSLFQTAKTWDYPLPLMRNVLSFKIEDWRQLYNLNSEVKEMERWRNGAKKAQIYICRSLNKTRLFHGSVCFPYLLKPLSFPVAWRCCCCCCCGRRRCLENTEIGLHHGWSRLCVFPRCQVHLFSRRFMYLKKKKKSGGKKKIRVSYNILQVFCKVIWCTLRISQYWVFWYFQP